MTTPKSILVIAAMLFVATVLAGEPFAATPNQRLQEKSAQARDVLAQVNALDRRFGRTVEAWDGARYKLGLARAQLAADRRMLRVAERQRRLAIARVEARLVALYESPDQPTTIGIIFGSNTLSDLVDELNAAQVVTAADHRLAVDTTAARDRYAAAERRTRATELQRVAALAQLDAQRQQIGTMLTQRRQLLSKITSQIAALRAEEARQQALLAAQARARLARQQAQRQQAQLRQQARERARAAGAASKAASTPAPAATPAAAPTTTAPEPAPAAAPAQAPPSPPSPLPLTSTPAGAGHPEAATIAMRYLGVPYAWGGASPAGFDCSGLVMYVYAQLGIALPHYAAAQYGFGTPVPPDQLQPGDLVFFDGLGHVGIYIGGGQMIHAPHSGDVVKITPLAEFGASYVGARRV